jgi:hypothetical protein
MEPHGHEEGAETRSLADLVVVVEFRQSQPVCPVVLQEVGENPKVLLDVLVDLFGLSIGLQVISSYGQDNWLTARPCRRAQCVILWPSPYSHIGLYNMFCGSLD